ncbi:hypothetical protein MLD38_036207 [Melastoma candidum]|uniref:Uncharacterized protein n=1 Tax=Melastoma candidum TaxID=119954 RepID=A0ACB9LJE8_9MYRT|nr:hypothetical protein MLD38_036207 [Melastoma candidum]
MLNCLRKALIGRNPPNPQRLDLCLTQKKLFISYESKPISTCPVGSLTAHYLVSALGFTPESALSVSRSVPSADPGKAAEVIGVFDQSGFSRAQITRIVMRFPRVLTLKPGRTIRPKIEFLRARGASEADVVNIICGCPWFLRRSLEGHITPAFDMINRCLKSDSQTILSMRRCDNVSFWTVSAFVRNLNALQAAGVHDNSIRFLLRNYPNCLWAYSRKFDRNLERVKSMGCDPLKVKFVLMLHVLMGLAQSTWEKKVSIFRRWGWSAEETLQAFMKAPNCMMISEVKLTAVMEFFVNEMGLEATYFASYPLIISYSLKNRIIPRCKAVEALVSKKLIKPVPIISYITLPDISFVEKFISPYSEEHPFVQKIYFEKLGKHSIA